MTKLNNLIMWSPLLKAVTIMGLCISASLVVAHSTSKVSKRGEQFKMADCDVASFEPIKKKIWDLKPNVDILVRSLMDGSTWQELAFFCDTFGPRMSGSAALESAIDYLRDKMKSSGLDVVEDEVTVPHWEVVSQSCAMTAPKPHTMSILTLGSSVSTNGTIEAEVAVVHDWDDLTDQAQFGGLKGKIVVFNYKFDKYQTSVEYRTRGAIEAAKYGAVAALIRSVTPFSINSPHTGSGSKSIPTAAITVEDANLIDRWIQREKTVKIALNIQTKHHEDAKSRNLIADIRGTSKPDEIIFVSGHMDTWYNTAGAMDDGGGMMISYKALTAIKKLNFTSKRTMRTILWTAEEPGLVGAQQYFEKNKNNLKNFKVVIESDAGTFRPLGLGYINMGEIGQCILQELLFVMGRGVSSMAVNSKFEGSDIALFTDAGVPGLSLLNDNYRYFWFHHSNGDAMDVYKPEELDSAAALFASTLYVLSNLDEDFQF